MRGTRPPFPLKNRIPGGDEFPLICVLLPFQGEYFAPLPFFFDYYSCHFYSDGSIFSPYICFSLSFRGNDLPLFPLKFTIPV